MTWDDRAKRLTLEPGTPPGATGISATRRFRVVLVPTGATKDVDYTGKRVQIRF